MKIAIPMNDNEMAMHFGHCQKFKVYHVNDGSVVDMEEIIPPPHEPGVLPRFLAEAGISVILAGGMGQRAQQLFTANGIDVLVGIDGEPDELVQRFLKGELKSGANVCDH